MTQKSPRLRLAADNAESQPPLTLDDVMRRLYRAEIDCSIRSVWDAGWVVSINPLSDFEPTSRQQFIAEDFDKIAPWLLATAKRLYPEADLEATT